MSSYDVVMIRRGNPADSPSPVTIHGLPVWEELAERLRSEGHRFVVGMENASADKPIVLLWDFGSVARLPRKLLARARGNVVAWCLESPLVAHRAFHRLDSIARESAAVLTFPGAGELLHQDRRDRFHPVMYPISDREVADGTPWAERRFMAMINSNKSVTRGFMSLDASDPVGSARRAAASVLARSYSLRGSWSAPDLYAERVEALAHFARSEDFDLFGSGWAGPLPGLSAEQGERVRARYRGTAGAKRGVLSRYRFCLCYENTAFPGYITEKIFDCFVAGTIPVYLGAPDVKNWIPAEAFVNARGLDDRRALEHSLRSLSSSEAERIRTAGRTFLGSRAVERFASDRFLQGLVAKIREVVGSTG